MDLTEIARTLKSDKPDELKGEKINSIFTYWDPSRGRYSGISPDFKEKFLIDEEQSKDKDFLAVSSAFVLCGLIKSHEYLHSRVHELGITNYHQIKGGLMYLVHDEIDKLAKDILTEDMVTEKIQKVRRYIYPKINDYNFLTNELTLLAPKEAPAIKAIGVMESKGMIGPQTRRLAVAEVRVMMAWHDKTMLEPSSE